MAKSRARAGPRREWLRVHVYMVSGLIALGAVSIAALGLESRASPPAPEGVQYLGISVQTTPGSHHSYFAPGNFTVSSRGEVELTFTNYDPATAPVSLYSAQVVGVLGGSEKVWVTPSSTPTTVSSLGVNDVAHTFSISDGPYTINIPILPATSIYEPSVTQAVIYLDEPGTYTWWCSAPCGPLPMTLGGGMAGTITVTS